jgi:hypothetical protein
LTSHETRDGLQKWDNWTWAFWERCCSLQLGVWDT